MNDLVELIAEAAQSGLQGLTVFPTQDKRWQASTSTDCLSWSVHIEADPIAAIRTALNKFCAPKAAPVIAEDIFA